MDPIEGEFICRKCQKPLSINKIVVSKKGFALFEVQCSNKHAGKRKLNMSQQNEWMPSVIKHLYECPKCEANLTDLRQKTEKDMTLLLLNCPTHGKIKKSISTSFWYAMDALRKQLFQKPAYPSNYPAPYPPQTYPPGQYPPPQGYPPQGAPAPTYPPPSQPETFAPPPSTAQQPELPPQPTASSPTAAPLSPTGSDINAGDFCPACGEEITSGAKFCTNCGTELE
ncbi:MAG: zinc-ribbon domain-containing protein [Promethearchaeota archaeon]|nr:MAG: zinc-ribbon domain-containing protein [Candidatus Lokiarchaeota archaeon]